ncbi:MAG: DUF4386 domain-containing protein, partial [Bacteroidetes bacterium]
MTTNEVFSRQGDTSLRQAAGVAGVASLLMAVAAIFAEFLSHQKLVIPGNAAQTAQNLVTQADSFRMGMAGYLIVLICDVLVSWAFYVFLAPVHRSLSLLAGLFRLVYTAIFGMSLLGLMTGFRMVTDPAYAAIWGPEQLASQALMQLKSFDDGWAIALVFFAIHLLLIGYLLIRSGVAPKFLGVLLLMAGAAYLTDSFAKLLLPDYAAYKSVFTLAVALP